MPSFVSQEYRGCGHLWPAGFRRLAVGWGSVCQQDKAGATEWRARKDRGRRGGLAGGLQLWEGIREAATPMALVKEPRVKEEEAGVGGLPG